MTEVEGVEGLQVGFEKEEIGVVETGMLERALEGGAVVERLGWEVQMVSWSWVVRASWR